MNEQEKEFEELYNRYWSYVYKYEVKDPDSFPKSVRCYHKDDFKQQLFEEGLHIKISEGY